MIQEMRYSGVSANPSDYECADGSMSVSIGLVPEDGSFKPVMPPFEVIQLNDGEKVLFIHKTSSFEHFIIHNAEEGGLFSKDKTDAKRTNIGTVFDVANVNAVGNTLVILSASGINYYLWKDGSYKLLGDHIPDIEISFGLIGRPRLYSVSDESKSTFWIHLPERHDDLTKELSENNKREVTDQVMAKLNKFIANETVNKGRFCFPFFVRYALKLYDGSIVNHSAPILMNPSTTPAPWVFTLAKTGEAATDVEMNIMLVAATLDYRIVKNYDYYHLEDWSDIVKSIEVYISKPIYTYDQNGMISSFGDLDNKMSVFIGRLFAKNPGEVNNTPSEDKLLGDFSSTDFLNIYAEWEYRIIYAAYFSANREYPVLSVKLPEFTEEKVKETIENTSTFYKLRSIDIKDASADSREEIVVEDDYLQSLLTREVMTDDYRSHDKLYASYSFSYNNRLNISGVKRKPFNGFLAQSMFAYCTNTYTALSDENNTLNITPTTSQDSYRIDVYIKENGEDYVVRSETIPSDPCNLCLFNSDDALPIKSWGTYFFYPNVNAYKMIIYNYSAADYEVDLRAHEFLNGAFAKIDYALEREKNFSTLPSINAETYIYEPNKIYTSEVNNPFYFPLLGINTVGTGEILGICSAAKALSQGQFGQFPLYAFSTDGIWALEVSQTGTYSAKQPITRDVCINPKSITQIDSAVLFATDRGIMVISGSEIQCISIQLDSDDNFTLSELPNSDSVIGIHNKRAGTKEQISTVNIIPFQDFISECGMIYDYVHQRIIVYNPSEYYAYVYSLKSKSWGMMFSDLTDGINSYPEALAMSGNSLVDLSRTDTTLVNAFLVTRPFKIGQSDLLKTINTVIQRGVINKKNIAQILYGSNDLSTWHMIWSSVDIYMRGFSGTPYKYFRLVLFCKVNENESLSGCTLQYMARMANQPR